jgi:hypothetical protein
VFLDRVGVGGLAEDLEESRVGDEEEAREHHALSLEVPTSTSSSNETRIIDE